MVTGPGWWSAPWLVPAAFVVVCLAVVAMSLYLGRELLFAREERDEAELAIAQQWLSEVHEQRWEDPAAAWAAFLAAERDGHLGELVDEDPADELVDEGHADELVDEGQADELVDEDPDLAWAPPEAVMPQYVIDALNGHTSAGDCADSIFTRHGL